MNWEVADRAETRDNNIDSWTWKRGIMDISAYWDCSHPYRRVFEKRENDC